MKGKLEFNQNTCCSRKTLTLSLYVRVLVKVVLRTIRFLNCLDHELHKHCLDKKSLYDRSRLGKFCAYTYLKYSICIAVYMNEVTFRSYHIKSMLLVIS